MKKTQALFSYFIFVFFVVLQTNAGEYTNTFHLEVDAQGESLTRDPVESFNSAIEYATQRAISQGEGRLSGTASVSDGVLDSVWVKKEANLQVIDLKVLNHRFENHSSASGNSLISTVNVDITLEYLNVPKFVEDYNKTVMGASLRSMAIPGWGQFYNRQYTTGFLFAISFWTMYGLFIDRVQSAGANLADTRDTFQFQLPAMLFWTFALSESMTSRYLGKQGLLSLKQAYRLENVYPKTELKTERGFKVDLILFQIPLY